MLHQRQRRDYQFIFTLCWVHYTSHIIYNGLVRQMYAIDEKLRFGLNDLPRNTQPEKTELQTQVSLPLKSMLFVMPYAATGVPWWLSSKESACQCRRCRFSPWVRKIPWRKKWQPTLVFWLGKSHRQSSPWGHKELDMTHQLRVPW